MPHRSYSAMSKLEVILYAKEYCKRVPERKIDIDESNIRLCRKNKDEIE